LLHLVGWIIWIISLFLSIWSSMLWIDKWMPKVITKKEIHLHYCSYSKHMLLIALRFVLYSSVIHTLYFGESWLMASEILIVELHYRRCNCDAMKQELTLRLVTAIVWEIIYDVIMTYELSSLATQCSSINGAFFCCFILTCLPSVKVNDYCSSHYYRVHSV